MGGMRVRFTMSVFNGMLSFSQVPLWTNPVEFIDTVFNDTESGPTMNLTVVMLDSIQNINALLSYLVYTPRHLFNGNDTFTLTLNDLGSVGHQGPVEITTSLPIVVMPVDNLFEIVFDQEGGYFYVQYEKGPLSIGFYDVDSNDNEYYRVRLSVGCGSMSASHLDSEIAVLGGNMVSQAGVRSVVDRVLDIFGPFSTVVSVLQDLTYTATSTCSLTANSHGDTLIGSVENLNNSAQVLNVTLYLGIVYRNIEPSIISPAFPRWSLEGVYADFTAPPSLSAATASTQRSTDYSTAEFNYSQYSSQLWSTASALIAAGNIMKDELLVLPEQPTLEFWNKHAVSAQSELSVLLSEYGNMYMSSLHFNKTFAARVLSGTTVYLATDDQSSPLASLETTISVMVEVTDVSLVSSLQASPSGSYDRAFCIFQGLASAASVVSGSQVSCNITIPAVEISMGSVKNDLSIAITFVQVVVFRVPRSGPADPISVQHGPFLPLFLHLQPSVESVSPECLFNASSSLNTSTGEYFAVTLTAAVEADECLFAGDISMPVAYIRGSTVVCATPSAFSSALAGDAFVGVRLRRFGRDVVAAGMLVQVVPRPIIQLAEMLYSASAEDRPFDYVVRAEVTGLEMSCLLARRSPLCVLSGQRPMVPVSINDGSVFCAVTGALIDSTWRRSLSLSIDFGGSVVTNSVSVSTDAVSSTSLAWTNNSSCSWSVVDASSKSMLLRPGSMLSVTGTFPVSVDYVCSFVSASNMTATSLATTVSDNELQCPIPAGVRSGSAQLSIEMVVADGSLSLVSCPKTSLLILVEEPAIITGINPAVGFVAGETRVKVFGSYFDIDNEYSCVFGNQTSPAIAVDATVLVCVAPRLVLAPALNSEWVEVSITENGVGIANTTSKLWFVYVAEPTVATAVPTAVQITGGDAVTVHGFFEGFDVFAGNASTSFHMELVCVFGFVSGSIRVNAELLSKNQLVCLAPQSGVAAWVPILVEYRYYDGIKLGQSAIIPGAALAVRYLQPVMMSSVFPNYASVSSPVLVSVEGMGFADVVSDKGIGVACLFGDQSLSTPAVVVNDTLAQCLSPTVASSQPVDFVVSVSLSFGGLVISSLVSASNGSVLEPLSESTRFTLAVPAKVSSISPLVGSVDGGTAISVVGLGFKEGSAYSCVFAFGAELVWSPAVFTTASTLVCISPLSRAVGSVTISISENGALGATNFQFYYVQPLVVESVFPTSCLLSGGNIVSVTGSKFDQLKLSSAEYNLHPLSSSLSIQCMFGNLSSVALVTSDTLLSCRCPDGFASEGSSSTRDGPLSGPSPVLTQPFSLILSLTNTQQTPEVQVAMQTQTSLTVGFLGLWMISSLSPRSANQRNASSLLVRGANFPAGESVSGDGSDSFYQVHARCLFGETLSTWGRVVDSTTVECSSPVSETNDSLETAQMVFGISFNGVAIFNDNILFLLEDTSTVRSLSPSSLLVPWTNSALDGAQGTVVEDADMLVLGAGFNAIHEYRCLFAGTTAVAGKFINETVVSCRVPLSIVISVVGNSNHASVKVFEDDIECSISQGSTPLNLVIIQGQQNVSLTPAAGPATGGNRVVVSLPGSAGALLEMATEEVFCVFGLHLARAELSSDTAEATCTAPELGEDEMALVSFSFRTGAGLSVFGETLTTYQYVRGSYLYSARPSSFSASGGDSVELFGAGFVGYDNLSCVFFDALSNISYFVPATVISSALVNCVSPELSEAIDITVGLSTGEVAIVDTSGWLHVPVYTVATASSTVPSFGPVAGGIDVFIFGSGFSPNSIYSMALLSTATCSAGAMCPSVTSTCSVVSTTTLMCLLPANSDAGEVEVFISENGARCIQQTELSFAYVTSVDALSVTPAVDDAGVTILIATFLEPVAAALVEFSSFALGSSSILAGRSIFACIFDDSTVVSVEVIDNHTVSCSVPSTPMYTYEPTSIVSLRWFSKSLGDASVIANPAQVVVTSVVPTVFSYHESSVIEVFGVGFTADASIYCKFGNASTAARVLESYLLECLTPIVGPASVNELVTFGLSMNNNMTTVPTNITVLFTAGCTATAIEPVLGGVGGGEIVTILGSGFSTDQAISCSFGGADSDAVYVSNYSVYCVSPHSAVGAGSVNVSVLVDNVECGGVAPASLRYEYSMPAHIISSYPKVGLQTEVTPVFVAVQGLAPSSLTTSFACLFDDIPVPAQVMGTLNTESIICIAPINMSVGVSTLRVCTITREYCLLGSTSFRTAAPVSVDGATLVASAGVSEDVYRGTVSVHGANFFPGVQLSCTFGGINEVATAAVVLSSTELLCFLDSAFAIVPGGVSSLLSLQFDGLMVPVTNISVTLPVAEQIETQIPRISPDICSLNGNDAVYISGLDISDDYEFVVELRDDLNGASQDVPAHVVNQTALAFVCPPMSSAGLFDVRLLKDGMLVNNIAFQYEAELSASPTATVDAPGSEVSMVTSVIAFYSSDVIIQVTGLDFVASRSYTCVVNGVIGVSEPMFVLADMVSGNVLSCSVQIPPATLYGSGNELTVAVYQQQNVILSGAAGVLLFKANVTVVNVPALSTAVFVPRTDIQADYRPGALLVTANGTLDIFAMPVCLVGEHIATAVWTTNLSAFCVLSLEVLSRMPNEISLQLCDGTNPRLCTTSATVSITDRDRPASPAAAEYSDEVHIVTPLNDFVFMDPMKEAFEVFKRDYFWLGSRKVADSSPRVLSGSDQGTDNDHARSADGLEEDVGAAFLHCSISGDSDCFLNTLTSMQLLQKSTQMPTAQRSNFSVPSEPLLLDSVEPSTITKFNGTWISVRGSVFSNSTACFVSAEPQSVQVLDTLVLSPSYLLCYLPASANPSRMTSVVLSLADFTVINPQQYSNASAFISRTCVNGLRVYYAVDSDYDDYLEPKVAADVGIGLIASSAESTSINVALEAIVQSACGLDDGDTLTWLEYLEALLLASSSSSSSYSLCQKSQPSADRIFSSIVAVDSLTNRINWARNKDSSQQQSARSMDISISSSTDAEFPSYTKWLLPLSYAHSVVPGSKVIIFGHSFSFASAWCFRLQAAATPNSGEYVTGSDGSMDQCVVITANSLLCPIGLQTKPGYYVGKIFSNCTQSASPVQGERFVTVLPNAQSRNASGFRFQTSEAAVNSSMESVGVIGASFSSIQFELPELQVGNLPEVDAVFPVWGSVAGGTTVTVSGRRLSQVSSCKFSLTSSDKSFWIVPAVPVLNPGGLEGSTQSLICTSPAVPDAQDAKLSISYRAQSWVAVDQPFRFSAAPIVDYAELVYDVESRTASIYVVGSLFPLGVQPYCLISLNSTEATVVTFALTAWTESNNRVVCSAQLESGLDIMHKPIMLATVSVSFNAVDYIDVDAVIVTSQAITSQSVPSGPSEGAASRSQSWDNAVLNLDKSVRNQTLLTSPLSVPVVRSFMCDARDISGSYLSVPAKNADPYNTYTCFIDGASTGVGVFVSAVEILCPVPNLRPGSYLLTVTDSAAVVEGDGMHKSLAASYFVNPISLQCLPRPSLLAVQLSVSSNSASTGFNNVLMLGSYDFQVSIINLSPLVTITCRLQLILALDPTAPVPSPGSRASETVGCAVDIANVAHCVFAGGLIPGVYEMIVRLEGYSVLVDMEICLSSSLLSFGGSINRSTTEVCVFENTRLSSLTAVTPIDKEAQRRSLKSLWPREGAAAGGTDIEIVADSVHLVSAFACEFTSTSAAGIPAVARTAGYVVSSNRIKCQTPSFSPGNATVQLIARSAQTATPKAVWCCGWFYFVPAIRIVDINPKYVLQEGNTLLLLSTSMLSFGVLPPSVDLYCRIGSESVQAKLNSADSTVMCLSPVVATGTVSVSIGSNTEPFSNSVIVAALSSGGIAGSLSPTHGSWRGGTTITVAVSNNIALTLRNPGCLFGQVPSITNSFDRLSGTITCVAPSSASVGKVSVFVMDHVSTRNSFNLTVAPQLFMGYYDYEVPCIATAAEPAYVTQGKDASVVLTGANYRDSTDLACILGQFDHVLPAKWLSDTSVTCVIPGTMTVHSSNITLRVSNNVQDAVSANESIVFTVTPSNIVTNIFPNRGFVSGGTPIQFEFAQYFPGSLSCSFQLSEPLLAVVSSPAFRVDDSSFMCLSPVSASTGNQSLLVMDSSVNVLYNGTFVYCPVPTIINQSVSALYSNVLSSVSFVLDVPLSIISADFDIRFRYQSTGEVLSGSNCVLTLNPGEETVPISVAMCTLVAPSSESYLYVDVSVNAGIDYVPSADVLRIIPRSMVSSFMPNTFADIGGELVTVFIDSKVPTFGVTCRFSTTLNSVDMHPWERLSPGTVGIGSAVSCVTPTFAEVPVDDGEIYFSVYGRFGSLLLEPVAVPLRRVPVATAASESVLVAGLLSSLVLSWTSEPVAGLRDLQLTCTLANDTVPMRLINSSAGVCLVQPVHQGTFPLIIATSSSTGDLEATTNNTILITVVDSGESLDASGGDMVGVNASFVSYQGQTAVSFSSPTCALPSSSFCRSNQASVMTLSNDSVVRSGGLAGALCTIDCVLYDVLAHTAVYTTVISLQLCADKTCATPLRSTNLQVIYEAAVVAIVPSSGSTIGGNNLHLYGNGFMNDPAARCAFADVADPYAMITETPVQYKNSTCVVCTAPTNHLPGVVSVRIVSGQGLESAVSLVTYEYIPVITISVPASKVVLSLGGTVLDFDISFFLLGNGLNLACRFGDEYSAASVQLAESMPATNATAMDSSVLVRCVSPVVEAQVEWLSVALSVDRVDISNSISLPVARPPNVVFVDPLVITAGQPEPPVFWLSIDQDVSSVDTKLLTCSLGAQGARLTVDHDSLSCTVTAPLPKQPGLINLTLFLDTMIIFQIPVTVQSAIQIQRAYPLTGFAGSRTQITLSSTDPLPLGQQLSCCLIPVEPSIIGNHEMGTLWPTTGRAANITMSATIGSANHMVCTMPLMSTGPFLAEAFGIGIKHGSSGVSLCEPTPFLFTVRADPVVLSIAPQAGTVAGGTTVELFLAKPFAKGTDNIYCKFGSVTALAQSIGDSSVVCVTKPSLIPGEVNIEISINGIEFLPTGFYFEYFSPIVATSDGAFVTSYSVQPSATVYYISPSTLLSGLVQVVDIFGEGFVAASTCLLSNSVPLASQFISSTQIRCTIPSHPLGTNDLVVMNPSSVVSSSTALTFIQSASLTSSQTGYVSPTFGPLDRETLITIRGVHVGDLGSDLLCLVGDDWSYVMDISSNSVSCLAPPSAFAGSVQVKLATGNKEFLSGALSFMYINDPLIYDAQPPRGPAGSDLLILGSGFSRMPALTCALGGILVPTSIRSDSQIVCQVPRTLTRGEYTVSLQTNGQHFVKSGVVFEVLDKISLSSLWPYSGPALRGGTDVSIRSSNGGFSVLVDYTCMFGTSQVPAVVMSDSVIQCRTVSHWIGSVNVTVLLDGVPVHDEMNSLQFLFTADVSVDKVSPSFGYTSGEYPVFVFGSNFLNTSSLGCRFADMDTRGIYINNNSLVCVAPSPLGRMALKSPGAVTVEVTLNGQDYSESGVFFAYSEPCDQGFFCPGMTRQLCPNGTYCPENSRNFTLCPPGSFQPREGQMDCVSCPVGYICPDLGMSRPAVCPAGSICSAVGLRAPDKICPMGYYCLNATKSTSPIQFVKNQTIPGAWTEDYTTGVVWFDEGIYAKHGLWNYKIWPFDNITRANGQSRVLWPPSSQCDGETCFPGTTHVLAEAPFPCPIGHYCRSGVVTQTPIPKNFSTPQRCFDGFFCPRGSISPEGQGPCPNGYFCPTQLDAMICPIGQYCPGVGYRAPLGFDQ
jgi:hypothetical protein